MTDTIPTNKECFTYLSTHAREGCTWCNIPFPIHPLPEDCKKYVEANDRMTCLNCYRRPNEHANYMEKPVQKSYESNPNGANQFLKDPRQRLCWKLYITPGGETFGNARQSAIKAGYEEDYANQITTSKWFKDKVRRMGLLDKAENVLEEMLDMPITVLDLPSTAEEQYPHTPEDEEYDADDEAEWNKRRDERRARYVVTDPSLVKIKQDTAKFVAERQGKDDGWNNRTELSGPNGRDLMPVDPKTKAAGDKAIDEFLNQGSDIIAGTEISVHPFSNNENES